MMGSLCVRPPFARVFLYYSDTQRVRLRLLAHCPSLPRPLAWSPPAHDALGEQRKLCSSGMAKGRCGQPEVSGLSPRFAAAQRKQPGDMVCKDTFALHADAKA